MNHVFGYLILRFKDGREFRQINPSQTLTVINGFGNIRLYNSVQLYCYTEGIPYSEHHRLVV